MIIRIISLIITFTMLIFPAKPQKTQRAEFYEQAIAAQTEYLYELLQTDGALVMSRPVYNPALLSMTVPDTGASYLDWKSSKLCPYFSCIAATGLLEAASRQGRALCEKYISWHFDHLNSPDEDISGVDGTIYDYCCFVSPDGETVCIAYADMYSDGKRAGDYDSTDSYAAVFLKLLYTYHGAFPDSGFLDGRRPQTDRVVNAMLSTFNEAINLTSAKPTYDIYYLMDNCEVYEGLICAGKLYESLFSDSREAERLYSIAGDIRAAIETTMYSELNRAYYSSVDANGKPTDKATPRALSSFYPTAVSQLFPAMCGVSDKDSFRSRFIYNRFNLYFGNGSDGKNWAELDAGANFPWALIAKAAVMQNDLERVEKYFDSLNGTYFSSGCPYPYYCAEAGYVLSCASYLLK